MVRGSNYGMDDDLAGDTGLFPRATGPGIDERDRGTLTLPGAETGAPYGTSPYAAPADYEYDYRPERAYPESGRTESLTADPPRHGAAPAPPAEPAPAPLGEPSARPVRDQLWPHLSWEIVLAAACITEVLLLLAEDDDVFGGTVGPAVMLWVATAILLGGAVAISLRAGLPNIAIGAIAVGAGADYAWLIQVEGQPYLSAVGMVLAGGALAGLVIALFGTAFGVPSWAVSLGVAAVLSGLVPALAGSDPRAIGGETPNVHSSAEWWLAGAAGISVLGGLLLAVPALRRFVGRPRPTGDPARRIGFVASVAGAGALAGSGALAAAAGLLDTANRGTSPAGYTGMAELAMVGFSVALLGGVSAYGRRGGIFGVVLAATLLGLIRLHLDVHNADKWTGAVVSGVAILLGLAVTRVMERLGTRGSG